MNEGVITGLRIVDILLPIGRGQRQLILGDRGTGKTSTVISIVVYNQRLNYLSAVDGWGAKRLLAFYVGLNQNLSKIYQLATVAMIDWRVNFCVSTNSSSPSMMTFTLPLLTISMGEYYRDRGLDVLVAMDDLSKHVKSYCQVALIVGMMPSRQSFPSNIFNIHSSILERFARMFSLCDRGSITAFLTLVIL